MNKIKLDKVLQDKNGNASSKRVAGMIILSGGVIMGVALFIMSILNPVGDPSTAKDMIRLFLMIGGGLLGIGVLERKK